jgi:translation elongation factor EF-1beta
MAEMVLQYLIKTPEPNADADAMVAVIRKKLPDGYRMMEKVDITPLYFGIKAAEMQFITEEGEGVQDILENYLNDLADTGELELTFITRL